LPLPGAGCMGGSSRSFCRAPHAVARRWTERGGSMSWTRPAFEEIKMDAEAKSYFDGLVAAAEDG